MCLCNKATLFFDLLVLQRMRVLTSLLDEEEGKKVIQKKCCDKPYKVKRTRNMGQLWSSGRTVSIFSEGHRISFCHCCPYFQASLDEKLNSTLILGVCLAPCRVLPSVCECVCRCESGLKSKQHQSSKVPT